MKTPKLFALIAAAALSGAAVFAQTTPPPVPEQERSPAAAPARIDGNVFVAQLPTPAQLMKDAEAEGVTVDRIEQSDGRVLASYKYSNGTTRTYAYQLLSAAGDVPAPTGNNIASMSNTTPPATVVYSEPSRVYYYDSPRYVRYYDDPWDFWGPVTLGVGLGFAFNHGGGYYHGGYHGGFHGHGWRH